VHSGPPFGCSGTQCRESQRNRTCEPAVARRGRRRNARRPFLLACLESVRDRRIDAPLCLPVGQNRVSIGSYSKRLRAGKCGLVRLRLSTDSGCCGMPVPLAPRPPGSRTMHRDKKPCSPRRNIDTCSKFRPRSRLGPLCRPTGQTRQQAQSTIRGYGCWSDGRRSLILDRLISKLLPIRKFEQRVSGQVPFQVAHAIPGNSRNAFWWFGLRCAIARRWRAMTDTDASAKRKFTQQRHGPATGRRRRR
jgi:hypothetical protein